MGGKEEGREGRGMKDQDSKRGRYESKTVYFLLNSYNPNKSC